MATNKMRLRYAYRSGGDDFLEENYGIRFGKEDKNLSRKIDQTLAEHEEIEKSLKEENEKQEENIEEKIEYLETLDINQLRSMAKSIPGLSYKNIMKMKKEEIIAELLK